MVRKKELRSLQITTNNVYLASFLSGDGSHPVFGHGEKAEHGHQHHTHAEAIAAPGEPNLGY